jgi:hypothetical protein
MLESAMTTSSFLCCARHLLYIAAPPSLLVLLPFQPQAPLRTHTHELLSMLTRDFILKNDLCTIAEVECGNDGCDFVMAVLMLFM